MDETHSELRIVGRRERWLATSIFLLMFFSFLLHLCAFSNVFLGSMNQPTDDSQVEREHTPSSDRSNSSHVTRKKNQSMSSFDVHLLPFFCLMAHLIWTIVPVVVLDPCCASNIKSLCRIVLKVGICTLPLLLCTELSLLLIGHLTVLPNEPLLLAIKWLTFISALFISFWTGTLSDRTKWRGIHGGQIAPEHLYPFHL